MDQVFGIREIRLFPEPSDASGADDRASLRSLPQGNMRDSLEERTTPWHSDFLDSPHFFRVDLTPLWDLIPMGFRVGTLSWSPRRRRHFLAHSQGSSTSHPISSAFEVSMCHSWSRNTLDRLPKPETQRLLRYVLKFFS